ncbi:MAG: homoserine dehydrogenase [Candidatus Omnitrophota bacterium]
MAQKNLINIGVIGFGTIGSGVVKLLRERRKIFYERTGLDLNLKAVCDKDVSTKRDVSLPKGILTKDIDKVINDPKIDIVVELVGGVHPAKEFVLRALAKGKHVVTANKLLLATNGDEIFSKAAKAGKYVLFEASVAGGIPIVRSIREGLASNRFVNIFGILNGTSNYILSKMTSEGADFKKVLKEAQDKGYAEKDPSLDINGLDSAHKLSILSLLAFGKRVKMKDIYTEGIQNISPFDIEYARELGYVVKLLAIAKAEAGKLELRVHPTLLPSEYLLSSVSGVYNAISIDADLVGEQVYYGKGAGKLPTASAVLSDIIHVGHAISVGRDVRKGNFARKQEIDKIKKMDDVHTRYYIHFSTIDKPGVLARITDILGKNNISIASVVQKERRIAQIVPVVMITHEAKEADVQNALRKIDKLNAIKRKSVLIRLEK